MHWLGRHRRFVVAVICALCSGVIIAVHFFPNFPFLSAVWRQEQNFEDFLQREGRKTATHPDMVFLGIDQTTLELPPFWAEELASSRALQLMTERPYPWSREVWALLLDRVFGAGARAVMFDFVCNPPNDGDPAFHAALDRYRDRVVVGANFDLSQNMQAVLPNPALIPPPALQDDRVGFVIFFSDPLDRKVRSVRYMTTDRILAGLEPHPSQEVFYAMSARVLAKIGHAADIPHDFLPHQLRFSSNEAYPPRPLYEVFDPKFWHANYADGAFFKDKIIIVGASSQVAHDFVATPMSPDTPGPVLHLQAIAAAIDHEFLHPTSERTDLILVGLAGLLAWTLIAFVRRPLFCLIALLAIATAYLTFARVAYDRSGLLVPAVPVLSAFLAGGVLSLGFEFILERMEKLRTRRTLERYVSKNLVKEILENPDSFYSSLRGVRLPATILFSDIVGFTTMTESADPEQLVKQLNEYLSRMTAAVFENNGTLDKFIGDAVMAVWGNVSSRGVAEDAKSCARAALAMRRELHWLNQKWKADKFPPFAIGLGINHGDVLVGNIGSQEKADPTVIGDAVNLASRLEALTRTYPVDILVGERASELIRDEFHLRSVALVQVKGKTRPVEIFTLIAEKKDAGDREFLERLETYEAGFRKFRERDFRQAKILFSQFLEFYPDDALAKMYLERALEYEEQPPDAAWNAVEVFKKK
ncbi:MAG TPA: adenylate/guanylate cyclase domain-containing protein [Chthoniobacterales bacterium]|nr:adenylate/guanylate cyclase domain-containing protein [Chthoniobacterales bacterium]